MLKLSDNEWLNDSMTHFMKSGPTVRSPENSRLTAIADKIPRSYKGKEIKYDIAYESEVGCVKGFKFTDLLTQLVWLSPCNTDMLIEHLTGLIQTPDEQSLKLADTIYEGVSDKYDLRAAKLSVEKLVVLPGTNLMVSNCVDMSLVDALVKDGALVKMHPLTTRPYQSMLARRYGAALINADYALYPIVREAKQVYCCMSSEVGLYCALDSRKGVGIIDNKEYKRPRTYEALYRAMNAVRGLTFKEKFAALLGSPESGLLSLYSHHDLDTCITGLLDRFADYPSTKA